jgi:serologically defined colon cancer antigen 8
LIWLLELFFSLQAELEVRRLKDELDRQHEKMRELLQEQGRKVQDERMQLERRYTQQMEQLSTDLTCQWDSSSKLQLELEKQRRVEVDLRRDLQQKSVTIEELKKELQNKIGKLFPTNSIQYSLNVVLILYITINLN